MSEEDGSLSTYVRIFLAVIGIMLMVSIWGYFWTLAEVNTDPFMSMLIVLLPLIIIIILFVWAAKGVLFSQEGASET